MNRNVHFRRDQGGYTLVELLVVILIVGILAAIAIAIFVGQSSKAFSAEAKETLHAAQTAIESYGTDHKDVCGATRDDLVKIEPTLAGANALTVGTCAGGDTTQYSLSETSSDPVPVQFALDVDHGVTVRSCWPSGENGCRNGTW